MMFVIDVVPFIFSFLKLCYLNYFDNRGNELSDQPIFSNFMQKMPERSLLAKL